MLCCVVAFFGTDIATYCFGRASILHIWTSLRLLCVEHIPLPPIYKCRYGARPDSGHRHSVAVLQLWRQQFVGIHAPAVYFPQDGRRAPALGAQVILRSGLPDFQPQVADADKFHITGVVPDAHLLCAGLQIEGTVAVLKQSQPLAVKPSTVAAERDGQMFPL